jgi:L-iditol 2-dehydrogenase
MSASKLSVAIHATKRASIEPGDTVIVFGAGTVGLLVAAMAQLSGATNVLIADIDTGRVGYALKHRFANKGYVVSLPEYNGMTEDKLNMAKELAADVVEKAFSQETSFGEDMDVEGADVVFDCTGKEICVQAGLYVSHDEQAYFPETDFCTGCTTRWPACHGRHGHADSDIANVRRSPQGG